MRPFAPRRFQSLWIGHLPSDDAVSLIRMFRILTLVDEIELSIVGVAEIFPVVVCIDVVSEGADEDRISDPGGRWGIDLGSVARVRVYDDAPARDPRTGLVGNVKCDDGVPGAGPVRATLEGVDAGCATDVNAGVFGCLIDGGVADVVVARHGLRRGAFGA